MDDALIPPGPNLLYPVENTQELLKEFDSVYNAVHYTHLTPPQTPTYVEKSLPVYSPSVAPSSVNHSPIPFTEFDRIGIKGLQNIQLGPVVTQQSNYQSIHSDIINEIQFVDEIVRSRCKDLPEWIGDGENSSSGYSYTLSPRSEFDSSCSSGSHDEDWDSYGNGSHRSKPYERPTVEKHYRKKEQNKNAATRYRQKKKQEIEEILVEERQLTDVHDKLAKEYGEIKREVKYLKNLMRELFKSKGMLD